MAVSRRFGIVSDHHDGLAEVFIELAQKRKNGFGAFRIEIAGRLIGEHDFRFADDGARERDALLLAAGKLRRLVIQAALEAQQVGDDFEAVRIETISVDVLGERDVVIGVESGQKIEALKYEADFVAAQKGSGGIAHGGKVVAIEQHASARGLRETAHHVEHGGFSAAGRSHDGKKFAGHHFHVDSAEGRGFHFSGTVGLPEIFCFEYRLQRRSCACKRTFKGRMILFAFVDSA